MSRIYESCISSEDIRIDTGADYIIQSSIPEIDLMLVKDEKYIGCLDTYVTIQGADIVVKKVIVYGNKELSYELTQKILG